MGVCAIPDFEKDVFRPVFRLGRVGFDQCSAVALLWANRPGGKSLRIAWAQFMREGDAPVQANAAANRRANGFGESEISNG